MKIEYTKDGLEIFENENTKIVIPWYEIKNKMTSIQMENKILVHFEYAYGKDNFFDSYILDIPEWNELKNNMMGKTVYLGEIAGKHSCVNVKIDNETFNEITDIDEIIEFNNEYGYSSTYGDIIGRFLDEQDE